MYNTIKDYKDISLEILREIKEGQGDQEKVSELLDKRQELLDKVTRENQLQRFRIQYAQQGLDKLDEEMRLLLLDLLNKTKEELIVHKKKQNASNAYMKSNRVSRNIFSTKS